MALIECQDRIRTHPDRTSGDDGVVGAPPGDRPGRSVRDEASVGDRVERDERVSEEVGLEQLEGVTRRKTMGSGQTRKHGIRLDEGRRCDDEPLACVEAG